MVPTVWMIVQACLVALGLWWCKEVIWRFREDVAKLRHGDAPDRAVVVLFWLLTIGVAVLIVTFGYALVSKIVGGIRSF